MVYNDVMSLVVISRALDSHISTTHIVFGADVVATKKCRCEQKAKQMIIVTNIADSSML